MFMAVRSVAFRPNLSGTDNELHFSPSQGLQLSPCHPDDSSWLVSRPSSDCNAFFVAYKFLGFCCLKIRHTHFQLRQPFFSINHIEDFGDDSITRAARNSKVRQQGARGPSSALLKSVDDYFYSFVSYEPWGFRQWNHPVYENSMKLAAKRIR